MRVHQHDPGRRPIAAPDARKAITTWSALLDLAAIEMGIDRLELRRRNFIKPRDMPFKWSAGTKTTVGDFPGVFKHALELADCEGFKARKRDSKKSGKLRGLGVGCYLEVDRRRHQEMGGIRFEDDGTVTIVTGTLDYGQGHAATSRRS